MDGLLVRLLSEGIVGLVLGVLLLLAIKRMLNISLTIHIGDHHGDQDETKPEDDSRLH